MKVTKQQKIASGILAAAVLAFVVDRVAFSDGPATASAVPAATVLTGTATPSVRSAAVSKGSDVTGVGLTAAMARRLSVVAGNEGIEQGSCADGFCPPAEWFAPSADAAGVGQRVRITTAADRAAAFKATHKLTAVLRTDRRPNEGLAVIQGRPMRIGQTMDGFTLTSVHDRSAVLADSRGLTVELELPRPGAAIGE